MDPKLVKLAKEIPGRLKEVVNQMFEHSEPALRSGVTTLRQSLAKLDRYLGDIEKEHLASTGAAPASRAGVKRSPAQAPAAAKRRRRRGRRKAGIAAQIRLELEKAPAGLRPIEVAARIAAASGTDKAGVLGNVNTTLGRMRKAKVVVNKGGVYVLVTPAAAKPAAKPDRGSASRSAKKAAPKKSAKK